MGSENIDEYSANCKEWTYKRGEKGDIQVYAATVEEAVETMKEHGFKDIDVKKLVATGMSLKERLEAK